MAQNQDGFDIFDPTGMLKTMRHEQMDAWAKMMAQFVHTEAYAEATAKVLDGWLSNSAPIKSFTEATIAQALANMSLPSRDDVSRLAERFTNVEMRLDDLEAKVDEVLSLTRPASPSLAADRET